MRITMAVIGLAALVVGCSPVAAADPPAEPPNLGDLKQVATEYYDSGAYAADLQAADAPAADWIRTEAPRVDRPAVVFDIDETALSNWEVIKANDFGRVINGPCQLPEGPCSWGAWDMLARSSAIAPTLDVFDAAKASGADVFFITGRHETQRPATERNLRDAGYLGYTRLIMEPPGSQYRSAADFKAPQRELIEQQGYTIIANIGDQPSDLDGGHAEQTFLLPNPFYRVP